MALKALDRLAPFCTIGARERINVVKALKKPLSGFLGGFHTGGYWVNRLEREWETTFETAHAIACNSATSGLLAACMAADVGFGDEVWVTAYSMSATAACAHVLGAQLRFIDIRVYTHTLNPLSLPDGPAPKALIVTNLFGNPADLHDLRRWCDDRDVILIEDNAQAPLASEGGQYTGTIGHIGVFSLNIHKHIQCGEGGVVVCHDSDLALLIHDAINHGELSPQKSIVGLNLRMTETTAAIACAQLKKVKWIVSERREIALTLSDSVRGSPGIHAPLEWPGRTHVYYLWCPTSRNRDAVMKVFEEYKFPIRAGYTPPLTTVFPHIGSRCDVAETIENEIMVYENCAYSPTRKQLKLMCDILKRAGDAAS